MNEIIYTIWALLTGVLTGILFFGGLWFTVKEGVRSKIPALWFLVSFVLRMAITMTIFYFVSRGSWQRSLICLLGFILARFVVSRSVRTLAEKRRLISKEVAHEA